MTGHLGDGIGVPWRELEVGMYRMLRLSALVLYYLFQACIIISSIIASSRRPSGLRAYADESCDVLKETL